MANAMEDPSFGLNGIRVVNIILRYFYVGVIITCFILALGNRPQGSKWGYTFAITGFAFITIYMTIVAYYLAIRGLAPLVEKRKGVLGFKDLVTNAIFRNIVLSLVATLGLYILASLIFVSFLSIVVFFLLTPKKA
jgi:chitin synthase